MTSGRQIVRMKFGSHLYGTSTPASDVDFKSVFIPDGRAILLQRAKGAVNDQRPKAEFEKNVAGEVEEERFSLQRFLALAAEGQTVALDMLFAPEWAWTEPPTGEWHEILANRYRLLTRKAQAFVGYAMKQASKYGIKGSRVGAARVAREMLELAEDFYGASAKLEEMEAAIRDAVGKSPHMAIVPQAMANGGEVLHWEVCGRKMPYSSSIKNAHAIMSRLVDEYGKRALQAESSQGVDWKALSHAVRVANQAIELLTTGRVTFPLPNAAAVLEIKLGQRPYVSVAAEIESLLENVKAAAEKSSLPDEPDYQWIDDFVADVHRGQVLT